jgi:hypothetical protein
MSGAVLLSRSQCSRARAIRKWSWADRLVDGLCRLGLEGMRGDLHIGKAPARTRDSGAFARRWSKQRPTDKGSGLRAYPDNRIFL